MVTAAVVCGTGYGDEGKGQTVHQLSNRDTCVVRFNGGAQAGHTVIHQGKRNIFHQLGAGSYKGAATYLGPQVLVNPYVYQQESKLFPYSTMFVDARCRVTTYVDMIINQLIESSRGNYRHGSCGMGIYETIHRQEVYPLVYSDLGNPRLIDYLFDIWSTYGPSRLTELGHEDLIPTYYSTLTEDVIRQSYYDMMYMYHNGGAIQINTPAELVNSFSNFVFEGAQGLLLSECNTQWMPHLTPSDTGITNAMLILNEIGRDQIDTCDVWYVTRPYLTRHGAGPLNHEWGTTLPFDHNDLTNVPNEWQGTIRYAPLNLDLLCEHVYKDFSKSTLQASGHIIITCMDQIRDKTCDVVVNNNIHTTSDKQLLLDISAMFSDMSIHTRYF